VLTLTRVAICVTAAAVLLFSVPIEKHMPVFEVVVSRLLPEDSGKEILFSYFIASSVLTWFDVYIGLERLKSCG
jgi:hypothetical protein